jgi:MFS family permease
MKIELFRLRNFWVGNVIAFVVAFGMLGIFFPMTLFLQGVLGMTPIRAGLTMTPMSVMIMFAAPMAGRLTDKIGARWILTGGLMLMTVGILFIVSRIGLDTDWKSLAPALIVTGLGMGMTFAPMTAAAMREVPPRIAGSASGILNTTRNVGQVLGIAVLGSLLQSEVGSHTRTELESVPLDSGVRDQVVSLAKGSRFEEIAGAIPQAQADLVPAVFNAIQNAFVDSIHITFLVGSVACLIGALTALAIRDIKAPSAERHRESLERATVPGAD